MQNKPSIKRKKDAEFGPAKELKQNADGTYSENFEQKTSTSDTITKNPVGLALMSMNDAENYAYANADEEGKKELLARKIEELNLKENDPKLEKIADNTKKSMNDRYLDSARPIEERAQFKEDDKKPGLLSSIVSMFTGGSSDVNNSKLVADQKQSSTTVTNITNNNVNQNTDNSVSNSAMVNKASIDHEDQTARFLSGSEAVAEY